MTWTSTSHTALFGIFRMLWPKKIHISEILQDTMKIVWDHFLSCGDLFPVDLICSHATFLHGFMFYSFVVGGHVFLESVFRENPYSLITIMLVLTRAHRSDGKNSLVQPKRFRKKKGKFFFHK